VSALHAGGGAVYWDYNATVERFLISDWMQGVTPKLESLLANYSVLIYNGQLDGIALLLLFSCLLLFFS
jgi:hypothetical protein